MKCCPPLYPQLARWRQSTQCLQKLPRGKSSHNYNLMQKENDSAGHLFRCRFWVPTAEHEGDRAETRQLSVSYTSSHAWLGCLTVRLHLGVLDCSIVAAWAYLRRRPATCRPPNNEKRGANRKIFGLSTEQPTETEKSLAPIDSVGFRVDRPVYQSTIGSWKHVSD